jgi:hypothetical protein
MSRKLRNAEGQRVLDEAARQRRLKKQLEALERDNHHDDPHQNVPQITHKLPSFSDGETSRKKLTLFTIVTHAFMNEGRRRKTKTEVRIKQVRLSERVFIYVPVFLVFSIIFMDNTILII